MSGRKRSKDDEIVVAICDELFATAAREGRDLVSFTDERFRRTLRKHLLRAPTTLLALTAVDRRCGNHLGKHELQLEHRAIAQRNINRHRGRSCHT